jgi:anti-anti-sigma factor
MAFRRAASVVVDRIPTGTGRLVIDCSSLDSIDSSGLNALIILQRKAEAKRVPVALRHLREDLRALLSLTKLEDLFEMDDGQAR